LNFTRALILCFRGNKIIYSKLFGEYAEVLRFHSYLFI
jgi:hypothetical protein